MEIYCRKRVFQKQHLTNLMNLTNQTKPWIWQTKPNHKPFDKPKIYCNSMEIYCRESLSKTKTFDKPDAGPPCAASVLAPHPGAWRTARVSAHSAQTSLGLLGSCLLVTEKRIQVNSKGLICFYLKKKQVNSKALNCFYLKKKTSELKGPNLLLFEKKKKKKTS